MGVFGMGIRGEWGGVQVNVGGTRWAARLPSPSANYELQITGYRCLFDPEFSEIAELRIAELPRLPITELPEYRITKRGCPVAGKRQSFCHCCYSSPFFASPCRANASWLMLARMVGLTPKTSV